MFVFVLVPLLIVLGAVLVLVIPLAPVVAVLLVAALVVHFVHRHRVTQAVKSVHSY